MTRKYKFWWSAALVACWGAGYLVEGLSSLFLTLLAFWSFMEINRAKDRNRVLEAMVDDAIGRLDREMERAGMTVPQQHTTLFDEANAKRKQEDALRRQRHGVGNHSTPGMTVPHRAYEDFVSWHDALLKSLTDDEITPGLPKISDEDTEPPDDERVDHDHPTMGVLRARGEIGPMGRMYGNVQVTRFNYINATTREDRLYFLGFRRTNQRIDVHGTPHYIYEFYKAWMAPETKTSVN